jgi:hypothetical protein
MNVFKLGCILLTLLPLIPALGFVLNKKRFYIVYLVFFLLSTFLSWIIALGIVIFLSYPGPLDGETKIPIIDDFVLNFYASVWIPTFYFGIVGWIIGSIIIRKGKRNSEFKL